PRHGVHGSGGARRGVLLPQGGNLDTRSRSDARSALAADAMDDDVSRPLREMAILGDRAWGVAVAHAAELVAADASIALERREAGHVDAKRDELAAAVEHMEANRAVAVDAARFVDGNETHGPIGRLEALSGCVRSHAEWTFDDVAHGRRPGVCERR